MFLLSKTEAMHVHHHAVIHDFKSSEHHLQIKHKGSISHKYSHVATLILLAIFLSHSECTDISQEGEVVGTDRRVQRRWTGG